MDNGGKHIGLVLPAVPGYSETFFRNKILGLQKSGFQVTLFVKNLKGSKELICPVKVHPMLFANPVLRLAQTLFLFLRVIVKAPKATFRFLKIAKQNGYSFIQAIRSAVIGSSILPEKLDWLHFGFATAALERELVGKAIGAKVAVSFRGFDLNQTPLLEKNVYQKLWPNVDKVHSISSYLIRKGIELGLDPNTPTQLITPAVNAEKFTAHFGQRVANRILLVSRLHWIKGIETVIQALAESQLSEKSIRTTIVGEGEEYERLVFAAHQLGISDKIKFLGKQNHETVIELMKSHDIFIQYSFQEGFCNAVLEAQAAGMLCVVSDAEGLQENLVDGKTGWVVPKRNPKALATKLKEVLSLSEEAKQKIRKQARERVALEFNLEKQEEEFLAFYTEN